MPVSFYRCFSKNSNFPLKRSAGAPQLRQEPALDSVTGLSILSSFLDHPGHLRLEDSPMPLPKGQGHTLQLLLTARAPGLSHWTGELSVK